MCKISNNFLYLNGELINIKSIETITTKYRISMDQTGEDTFLGKIIITMNSGRKIMLPYHNKELMEKKYAYIVSLLLGEKEGEPLTSGITSSTSSVTSDHSPSSPKQDKVEEVK